MVIITVRTRRHVGRRLARQTATWLVCHGVDTARQDYMGQLSDVSLSATCCTVRLDFDIEHSLDSCDKIAVKDTLDLSRRLTQNALVRCA